MINKVKQEFEKRYGSGAALYTSPGRVNLIGEHTDYNMGFVLPGAVDKGIYAAIRPIEGAVSCLYSVDYDAETTLDLSGATAPEAQWAKYIYGVAQFLHTLHFVVLYGVHNAKLDMVLQDELSVVGSTREHLCVCFQRYVRAGFLARRTRCHRPNDRTQLRRRAMRNHGPVHLPAWPCRSGT